MTAQTRRLSWPELRQREMQEYPEVYEAYERFLRDVATTGSYEEDRPMIEICAQSDIPAFTSEDEEHEYWAVHEFSEGMWQSLPRMSVHELRTAAG